MNKLLFLLQTVLALVALPLLFIGVEATTPVKTVLVLLAALAAYNGMMGITRNKE